MFWVDSRTADVMEGERPELMRQGRPEDALLGPYPTRADAETAAAKLRRRQAGGRPSRWEPAPWESWAVQRERIREGYPLQFGLGLTGVGTVGVVGGLALGEPMLAGLSCVFLAFGAVLVIVGWSVRP